MTNTQIVRDLARAYTREALAGSPSFHQLTPDEQREVYRHTYQQQYRELAEREPHNGATARAFSNPKKASDMIDDERHYNKRIEQAGELAGDFIDEVDFPGFVKDLLKGVFDANLQVTLAQIETYQKLLKTATESVAKFVNAIDDTAAFGYLAENQSDDFNIAMSPSDRDENGQPKPMLTDRDGEPVDLGDNQVKAKIMEAKIAMAREQRALLREVILMGITRLVVERGNVKASVVFDIKAQERIQKSDMAALKESMSNSQSLSAGGGLIGKIVGGPEGGMTRSQRKTKISVSSAKSEASTDLTAKVAGSVDITFKSDYFKLDNFASMYGPQAGGVATQPALAPTAPAAAPRPAGG
jgi:hypothetical protein